MSAIILGKDRNNKDFKLSWEDRRTHLHVLGASGQGKSKFLENMIRQDILDPQKPGVFVLDPHGTLYDKIVAWCAWVDVDKSRTIHLINPTETYWATGFNPLRDDGITAPSARVEAMMEACAQVWGGEDAMQTPLLRKCLRAVFYCLLEKRYTILESLALTSVTDPNNIRAYLTQGIKNKTIEAIWDEFNAMASERLTQRLFLEQFSSTVNRLTEFLSSPVICNTIGQLGTSIDFRKCMDDGDIVLVNLATSNQVSAKAAQLLGTLFLNDIFLSARGRDEEDAKNHPFFCYIDECYDYLTSDVEKMIDQTRKFGVHLILSHQRLGQLRERGDGIYNAVKGIQAKVIFGGLEYEDVELMAGEIFMGWLTDRGEEITKNPTVVRYMTEWLEAYSDTEGRTSFSASGFSEGASETLDADGDLLSQTLNAIFSGSDGEGSIRSHTESRHQVLKPVLEDRYSQTMGYDKLEYEAAGELKIQTQRNAMVKLPGKPPAPIVTAFIHETLASPERIKHCIERIREKDPYALLTSVVEGEIENRLIKLKEKAEGMLHPVESAHFRS